jgi:acetyl esterase/lipase
MVLFVFHNTVFNANQSTDLAPGAIYPRQLQQAAALLSHVLENLKIKPENIILTGDSAGANLCTQLLSHLSHPHPSTSLNIPPVALSAPLRGVVLISPWVNFDTSTPSFINNEQKDCVSQSAGKAWSAAFLACPWPHHAASDYYNQAVTAPPEWWEGLKVESVLIVAGADEVLVDGIMEFKENLEKGFGKEKVAFFMAKGEYHDQPSIDLQLGYQEKDEGLQARKIKDWIGSKL